MPIREACPVCEASTRELAPLQSSFTGTTYAFRQCPACGLAFVADPCTDLDRLYDEAYYAGQGADPFVDYLAEMADPQTVRTYEWRGIFRAVKAVSGLEQPRWLDFGCGLGGLVRYAREQGLTEVYGYDSGFSATYMREHGVPCLDDDDLERQAGTFDVVSAIEVIEHVTDPVGMMTKVAELLRPGGIFFLTTGNAEPHRDDLAGWSYVHPDVHIAYFEPRTLEAVYERSGLEPLSPGFLPGHDDIIRYKVLKTMRVRSRNVAERLVPWPLASRLVDRRHRVTAQPLARKPGA